MSSLVIDNERKILLDSVIEDGCEWVNVTYKHAGKEINIGSYYTYNYSGSTEKLLYNSNLIVIINRSNGSYHVNKMFDIKTELFVIGSDEDLLEYYKMEFEEDYKNKNVSFDKSLFIKKVNYE